MGEGRLLVASGKLSAKTREIGSRSLISRKRQKEKTVSKVVVRAQVLSLADLVVDSLRELVNAVARVGDYLKLIGPQVGQSHKLAQQVECRGIETMRGNNIFRKENGVFGARHDGRATFSFDIRGTPRSRIEDRGHIRIRESS